MDDATEDRVVMLNQLAEEFAARQRKGESPRLEEYCGRHPELAEDIRSLFPAMVELEQAKADAGPDLAGKTWESLPVTHLGDFHLLREVGRGGMGVVYEAEQVSLGRRVALKLLPATVFNDPVKRRRFEREAKAAAKLHHTNIVPVHGFGEHNGTSYYVMQFIPGLGLDAVIAELARSPKNTRLPTGARAAKPTVEQTLSFALARSLEEGAPIAVTTAAADEAKPEPVLTPVRSPGVTVLEETSSQKPGKDNSRDLPTQLPLDCNPVLYPGPAPAPVSSAARSASSVNLPGQSGSGDPGGVGKKNTYWQSVARIGVQVAGALAYAHKLGILHRDIKPSNLLLDLDGVVWVADFGLAKADDSDNLTHTGDILGTLRYMAPEAFEGKSDARSDVYALGLTLFELIALRPAYQERDRNKLIKQVTTGEPLRLRKLCMDSPRDLVTIVEKAIDKVPARRYQTAEALANDLQRFLEGRPIAARRATELERVWMWARRNPAVAALLSGLAAALLLGVAGIIWKWRDAEAARHLADANARAAQAARDIADANAHTAEANAMNAEANASKANAALALSEANFALAQESVEKYLMTVADSKALRDPDLVETRRQLIQSAREFYEQFINLKADDASSRAKLGTAFGKLAQIAANTDSDMTACTDYAHKSRAVFTKLLEEDPAKPAYSIGLGYAEYALAHSLYNQNRHNEADLLMRSALDRYRAAASRDGRDREMLGFLLRRFGERLSARDRYAEAADAYAEAARVADQLREAHPKEERFAEDAALDRFNHAFCRRMTGDPKAETLFAQVEVEFRALAARRPTDPLPHTWLGDVAFNRGMIARARGDWPAAAKAFIAAAASYRQYLDVKSDKRVRSDATTVSILAGESFGKLGHYMNVEPLIRSGLGLGQARGWALFVAVDTVRHAADRAAADATIDAAAKANRRAHLLEYGGWLLAGMKGYQPMDAETCLSLARHFATWPDPLFRDPARALILAKTIREKSPANPEAAVVLGIAHFALGDDAAAEKALSEAATLPMGDTAEARFYRAAAAARLGNQTAAAVHYRAAKGPAPAVAKLAADVALGYVAAPDAPPKPAYDAVAGLDRAAFNTWLDGLSARGGFYPTQVNAHDTPAGPRFSAVAVNDGINRTWKVDFDLGADGFQRRYNRETQESFAVVSLCGYSEGNRPAFVSVWVNKNVKIGECRHGISPEEFPATAKKNRAAGSRPVSVSAFLLDGRPRLTTIYGLDQGFDSEVHDALTAERVATLLNARRSSGWKPGPVGIVKYNGEPRFTLTLLRDPQAVWETEIALPATDFPKVIETRTAAGFHLEQIVGYAATGGSMYFTVWVRDAAVPAAPKTWPITGTAVPELAAFDVAVLKFMSERDIPAGTLAVMKDGQLVLSRGYGHLDRERTRPVPPDTPFRLASVTKPVTAAAVRQLIAAGKFHEDTKVAEYLGLNSPAGATMDRRWVEITVEQLLRHRGGFDRAKAGDPMFQTAEVAAALGLRGPPTPNDVLRYMAGRPLQFDPDSKAAYSNFGYCVLGRVIEKAAGKTYLAYVQDDLMKPLGITGFALGHTRPADRDPREPFYSDPSRGKDVLKPGDDPVPAPDGGFLLEMMDSHGGLTAPAPAVAAFLTRFRIDGRPTGKDAPPESHAGSLPGTYTLAARRPNGVVLVVLFNQRSDESGRGYDEILEELSKTAAGIETWPAPR